MKWRPAFTRFMEKVDPQPDGCWRWTASITTKGYGQFSWHGGGTAHRYSHTVFKGPIPEGLHIDHLCRNTWCVNPAHLEAVTPRENVLRGISPPAENAARTHCIHGHELTPDNLYKQPATRRRRACAECRRKAARDYWRRKRASLSLNEVQAWQ